MCLVKLCKWFWSLSPWKKVFFVILTLSPSLLVGSIVGGVLGLLVINFFPDRCSWSVVDGVQTMTCENPVHIFGLYGYEATGTIGVVLGVIVMLVLYVWCLREPN